MGEWIRFFIVAALLLLALACFASAVLGVWRFGYVMNRMHAAGIGDSLGIFCVAAALFIAGGPSWEEAKALLLVFFLWFTSPVSTHFLGQVEFFNSHDLPVYAAAGKEEGDGSRRNGNC